MTDTKPRKKIGRPTLYEKGLIRTFLIDQDVEDTINLEAEAQRCSRSDALVYLIKLTKQRRRRA